MKRGTHKVIIGRKVDLDAALTAFLLGISEDDEIVVVAGEADIQDLADPRVICIECGGSGQTDLNNFDHHNTRQDLPSACIQALRPRFAPQDSEILWRLVAYASTLDTQGPERLKQQSQLPTGAFPTLSDIFSGMLLVTKDPKEQFLRGIGICRVVLQEKLDPFGLMSKRAKWNEYIEAKRQNNEAIQKAIVNAEFFETRRGFKAGFVETDVIGALGALYHLGCQIAIAYSPKFGNPPLAKYTIAGDGIGVDALLPVLNEKESGWGGPAHGMIVGSPRKTGSRLKPEEVIAVVREHL